MEERMGSFSWNKADDLTTIENIVYNYPFRFLIPKEFGGGFIKEKYQDYGYLGKKENGEPKYDMYELLAFWNHEFLGPNRLWYGGGEMPKMKEIDENTTRNRNLGIDIGCYANHIDILKFPLKLTSISFEGTYEDLDKPSYPDPDHGFRRRRRN